MSSREVWYFIEDGYLWRHEENDGWVAYRNGLEKKDDKLCRLEDAQTMYPKEFAKAYDYTKRKDSK